MAFAACHFADFTFFSLDLGTPGGPGRHGWSTDLDVSTISLDFWNSFSAPFGFGTMDNSLALWSRLEDLDTTLDTNLGSSLPLPSRPNSAPLQRDHQLQGHRLASPFQVSGWVFASQYNASGFPVPTPPLAMDRENNFDLSATSDDWDFTHREVMRLDADFTL